MYNQCCIVNCASRRKDANLYRFPKNEIRLQKWLQCINCERLYSFSVEDLRKHCVCQKHFEKRFIALTNATPRIRVGAYPTLFSKGEISSGIPQTAVTDDTDTFSSTHAKPVGRRHLRVILKRQSLTPNCRRLYNEFVKSLNQVEFSHRARRAIQFSKDRCFDKLTEKMNPLARKLMWMQIKQCTKKAKGRRFSNEEKLIALSIMKQSPKWYQFLHKIFILPSKYTLNKTISELNIEAGINDKLFEAIKQEVSTWVENKRYCSILFNKVALEAALNYEESKDAIDGCVELSEKTSDFADPALVFMLRGAIYKWQQPLAYYFCKGATSGVQLKKIIKQVITAVGNAGLLPIAVVCDQDTAFQSALKSLQAETRREQIRRGETIDEVIAINQHILSVIYDPPHLIKGLRNNFLTKDIKYENKISKWNDIVEVYKTVCSHGQIRLLNKLNDEDVIPDKIKKIKVNNCAKVLSKTVAAILSYTAQFSRSSDGTPVSLTLRNTAEIVSFFDDLFDSVNGSSLYDKKNKRKPLRQAVTGTSLHHNFFNEALKKLSHIRFVDKLTEKEMIVQSLKNCITTIKSYQRVWQFFNKKKFKIMRQRYFTSSCQ